MPTRCGWANGGPLEIAYHDSEWGVPSHDDRHLFEMLILEGAQAGLSWSTILTKREAFREVFHGFDPDAIAAFGEDDEARLLDGATFSRQMQELPVGRDRPAEAPPGIDAAAPSRRDEPPALLRREREGQPGEQALHRRPLRTVADDRRLFEKICLEGFQSGLSWLTILRKRENFRAAFSGFDSDRVARFGERFTWENSTRQFVANLVPARLPAPRLAEAT